jgi:hypothetical protein
MKKILTGAIASIAILWADVAAAQTALTGNILLDFAASAKSAEAGIASDSDFRKFSYLMGFCSGVIVTLEKFDQRICVPRNSNTGQYTKMLVQYLDSNPADLHKDGSTLAIAAFRKAFPCR